MLFASSQLSQMRQTVEGSMEQALDDSVKALKTYIHNQIAQVRLSLIYYISVYYFTLNYIIMCHIRLYYTIFYSVLHMSCVCVWAS